LTLLILFRALLTILLILMSEMNSRASLALRFHQPISRLWYLLMLVLRHLGLLDLDLTEDALCSLEARLCILALPVLSHSDRALADLLHLEVDLALDVVVDLALAVAVLADLADLAVAVLLAEDLVLAVAVLADLAVAVLLAEDLALAAVDLDLVVAEEDLLGHLYLLAQGRLTRQTASVLYFSTLFTTRSRILLSVL